MVELLLVICMPQYVHGNRARVFAEYLPQLFPGYLLDRRKILGTNCVCTVASVGKQLQFIRDINFAMDTRDSRKIRITHQLLLHFNGLPISKA